MRRQITRSIVGLMIFMIAAGGCTTMTGRTAGQWIDDKTITAKAKSALAAVRIGTLTRIDVDTYNGTVYLHGVVEDPQMQARAEETVKSVTGVQRVVNNLQLESPALAQSRQVRPAGQTPEAQPGEGQRSVDASSPMGVHSVTGEITQVDKEKGTLSLKTDEGTLELYFPPAALRNVNKGDRITVDLSLREAR